MKLLLHTCCAPCAIYAGSVAQKDNLSVTGFFYNPNIHPHSEYDKREKEAEEYFRSEGMNLICAEHAAGNFFNNVAEKTDLPERCLMCWRMRLGETASFASKNRFDAFTTTLLGSIYQDHEAIKAICEDLSEKKSVRFYYKDFRIGFRDAYRLARDKGIYCQNYCGCVFSMVEKQEAISRRNEKKYVTK